MMVIPGGGKVLRVTVYPDAGEDRVLENAEHTYEVWTRAPAANNIANREVCFLLARTLGEDIKKLRIISGHQSHKKHILLHP
jgi:uncharacterized protein YggU (UPF0235/DUF167 family)